MPLRCCSKGYNNLRAFFYLRPPMVIFIANLTIFALALMSLSYWIQYNDMQNPDATKDWNMFLERFASMEVCLTGNKSYSFIRRLSAFTIDGDSAIDLPQPKAGDGPRLAVHRMTLDIELDNRQRHLLSNYSLLIGAISGKILGLRDRASTYQVINITAVIPQAPRSRDSVCVEMVGPESIFPKTRPPKPCHSAKFEQSRRMLLGGQGAGVGGIRMSYMYIFKTAYWSSLFFCNSALPRLRLKYTHNPSLTEMLSTEEKYVAEENLSHTAYALAVLIACFLAYAAAYGAGRPLPLAEQQPLASPSHHHHHSGSAAVAADSSAGAGAAAAAAAAAAARSRNCYSTSERSLLAEEADPMEGGVRKLSSGD